MIARTIFISVLLIISIGFLTVPTGILEPYFKDSSVTAEKIEQTKEPVYPKPAESYVEAPALTAKSAAVIDAKTGVTLFEKNPNLKHLPASTTKMMTALVALENCSLPESVLVDFVEKEGTQMGLDLGDRVSVEALLNGLLISSGNDAAFALARNCADSYDAFVSQMNIKAKELEMVNTHFVNPAGFDSAYQYSTASDLAKLAKVMTANPILSKIVATKSTVVTDVSGNKTYYLENVNKLLGLVDGIEGVKTGQTEGSLEILISKTSRNGETVIVSILGSDDRFGETKGLIEWAFKNHKWQ